MNFVSESIHLSIHESKGTWEGSYVYAEHGNEEETTTPEEIPALSVKAPCEMTPRQRKTFKKYTTPAKHTWYGGGSRKYTPNAHQDIFEGIDPQILVRLGVDIDEPSSKTVARKDLVKKLIATIKLDLDAIAQEKEEATIREEGFWRFAGKTVRTYMERTRQDIDWATGQKKAQVHAEGECTDIAKGLGDFDEEVSPEEAALELVPEPWKDHQNILTEEKTTKATPGRYSAAKVEVSTGISADELLDAFKFKPAPKANKLSVWSTKDGHEVWLK